MMIHFLAQLRCTAEKTIHSGYDHLLLSELSAHFTEEGNHYTTFLFIVKIDKGLLNISLPLAL